MAIGTEDSSEEVRSELNEFAQDVVQPKENKKPRYQLHDKERRNEDEEVRSRYLLQASIYLEKNEAMFLSISRYRTLN